MASLGLVLAFYLWTASSSDNPFTFSSRPPTYYQDYYGSKDYYNLQNYYNMLTDSFLSGRLSLIVEPRKELLDLPDPYDPSLNARFRMHDASLYKGKYYLYFGPAPAVALFMPFRLIFRTDLPENLAAGLFGFGGVVWCVLLVNLLTRSYFPNTPFWMQLAALFCLSFSNVVPFILRIRGTIYPLPISSGYFFLFGALYWLMSGGQKEGNARLWRLSLGSLFLGLAVGSRPHFILAGIFPLFLWLKFLKEQYDYRVRKAWRELSCLFVPLSVCLVLLGVYNYARFDSWTEFGINYAVGGHNIRKWTIFDPRRILPDLFFYFLAPARMSLEFPFFHLAPSYPWSLPQDYYGPELVAGILTNIPFINILFLFPLYLSWRNQHSNLSLKWTMGCLIFLALSVAFFISQLSATMRYLVDFTTLLLVPALLLWFAFDERLKDQKIKQWCLRVLSVGAILYGCLFNLAISLTGYGPFDALKFRNPEAYRRIEQVFAPIRRPAVGPARPRDTGPPEATDALLARAIREHTAGAYDAAMELYHKVLQRDPTQPHAHFNLGQIYNVRGQYPQAQWEYEAALKAAPQSLDARLNLGVVLYRQRQFAPAAEAFRQVLKAAPANVSALFDLGITLLELGELDEASRALTAALRANPKWADAAYYLGLTRERQRRYGEARAALQQAVELNPRQPDAYVALARVHRALGERDLAQEAWAKAIELNPGLKQEGRQAQ